MSATDELRRMLDERGVEWMPIAWNPKKETFYHTSNGVGFCADEYADGVKIYTDATITPEQAIAATLGNEGVGRSNDGVAKLKAENARLRELVKGLYEFAYAEYSRAAEAGFADDLRKLGVEVDDD